MQVHLLHIDTAILTKRTVTRRFRENEGNQLSELILNNHQFIADHFPKTVKAITDDTSAEIFLRKKIAAWLYQEEYCFGIWENEKAKLIGFIRIFKIEWDVPKADLGYFIDQNYGGQGIMTEVMQRIIQFAFNQLGIERLRIRTAMDNYASQRLARKCGFRREGDLRGDFKKPNGEIIDVMIFGLLKSDFDRV